MFVHFDIYPNTTTNPDLILYPQLNCCCCIIYLRFVLVVYNLFIILMHFYLILTINCYQWHKQINFWNIIWFPFFFDIISACPLCIYKISSTHINVIFLLFFFFNLSIYILATKSIWKLINNLTLGFFINNFFFFLFNSSIIFFLFFFLVTILSLILCEILSTYNTTRYHV